MGASWLQEKIAARVHARNLSLAKCAKMFGVTYPTFIKRVTDPKTFSVGELQRMAAILGVSEDWLRNGGLHDVMDAYESWDTSEWPKDQEQKYE